jgi:GrpB-like predicted nucleotidyltransferase (UPF0157 family)
VPIEIADHDPTWPAQAEAALDELRATGLFTTIEHVGSTAVPGLAAKPVLDLMAAVDDLDAVLAGESALADLGYVREETGKDTASAAAHTAAGHRRPTGTTTAGATSSSAGSAPSNSGADRPPATTDPPDLPRRRRPQSRPHLAPSGP